LDAGALAPAPGVISIWVDGCAFVAGYNAGIHSGQGVSPWCLVLFSRGVCHQVDTYISDLIVAGRCRHRHAQAEPVARNSISHHTSVFAAGSVDEFGVEYRSSPHPAVVRVLLSAHRRCRMGIYSERSALGI